MHEEDLQQKLKAANKQLTRLTRSKHRLLGYSKFDVDFIFGAL
jgi:hypothetical protein